MLPAKLTKKNYVGWCRPLYEMNFCIFILVPLHEGSRQLLAEAGDH